MATAQTTTHQPAPASAATRAPTPVLGSSHALASQPPLAVTVQLAPGQHGGPDLRFEYLKSIPTTIVAIAVAYIAFKQWQVSKKVGGIAASQERVAREKFRLDLFDRRYKIFLVVWTYMSEASASLKPVPRDINKRMVDAIARAQFLFGTELQKFLIEVWERQTKREIYQLEAGPAPPDELQVSRQVAADNHKWLLREAQALHLRFQPYLTFGRSPDGEANHPLEDGIGIPLRSRDGTFRED